MYLWDLLWWYYPSFNCFSDGKNVRPKTSQVLLIIPSEMWTLLLDAYVEFMWWCLLGKLNNQAPELWQWHSFLLLSFWLSWHFSLLTFPHSCCLFFFFASIISSTARRIMNTMISPQFSSILRSFILEYFQIYSFWFWLCLLLSPTVTI